jgi:hypothetical protein
MLDGLSGDLNEEQREYLGIILRNVEQLKSMIQELLEVTRVQTGKLTIEPLRTDLLGVINETYASLKEIALSHSVKLQVDTDSELPNVYADSERVRQVLSNLIDNAVKYMDGDGAVTVTARVHGEDPHFVLVGVEDTGPGIEPEERERIFEQLYQGGDNMDIGRKGLGLGLYICRELVSRQGGKIWVESVPGKGSTFCFTLPVFSFKDIVKPVLMPNSSIADNLTLFSVVLKPPDGRELAKSEKTAVTRLRASVEDALNPESDLLIPKIGSESDSSTMFVLSNAGLDEIAGLSRQIRMQIDAAGELKERGYEYDLTISEVKIPVSGDSTTADEGLEQIAQSIQQLLEEASG